MAIKTLRVFQEFTSEGYVPMPIAGNIDYGVTIAGTFPGTTPTTFQTDDPDIDVTLTATTDYYVWIRSHGTDWNPMYTRNVRVYPDSPLVNNVVMGIIIANLSNTVPYVGATEDVDLGEFGLTAGYLGLDLTPTLTPTTAGTMSWNDADGTANLILKGGNVTLQIGQEQVTRIVNKTGANLLEANYQAVRVSGAQGNRLKVDLAQANIDANSAETLGLVTETINNNAEGFITTSGLVRNIDTTGTLQGETWIDGDILYLSGTTAGRVTNIKPQAPTHTVIMGYVVRAHQTQGQIYVKVDNGYELDELHNVKITSVVNKNILVYETATSLWKNRNIFGTQGYVPYYDDTLLMKNSVIYTDGTQVIIGDDEEFSVGNKLSVVGNIAVHKDYGYHSGLYQILFRQDATGEFRIGTNAANDYTTFYANGTERVRISPSGFLGVGVSNPLSILHVKGTTAYTNAIIDNNSASGGGYYSAYQNGAEKAIFGVSGAWLLDNSSDAALIAKGVGQGIQFYTNGSTSEKMGINSDGNVFVGQTPTYVAGATQLVVRGKTGAGFVGVNHYDMSIKGFMNTFNSVFQVGTSTFHSLAFLVEDIERGRVNSSGRLLWGTTTDNTIDLVQINGSLIATSLKKSGGTSSQFLMADGSVTTGVSNQITGTLTTNYIPKANGTNTITNSVIQEIGGIVGIGSTPSNWDYSGSIQLPNGGIYATRGSNNMLIAGALYNSGWKRNTAGFASMFEQNLGGFTWYTASSGAGLSDITWQQLMNLNPSGRLLINQTTDDGVNLIQANGAIISTAFKKSGGISSQFLKADGSVDSSVYITGITSPMVINALGFTPYNATNPSGFISSNQNITLSGDVSGSGPTSITTTLATITQASSGSFVKITLDTKGRVIGNVAVGSSDIISALGYTPYNSTNPSGYISGITSGMVTTALGYTPVTNARQLTINGTTYDLSADRSWTISGTIGGLTSGYIPKATSASTLGNSSIYVSGNDVYYGYGGNVRIGIDYDYTGTYFYGFATNYNARQTRIICSAPDSNAGISFETGGSFATVSQKMLLTSGGNLLVGTSTDSGYKLNVNGSARINNLLWFTPSSGLMALGANGTNLEFYNGSGAETRLTLTNSGNLGLGVTPSAWSAGLKALQIGSQTALVNNSQYTYLSTNWDGNGDKYLVTGYSTIYRQQSGEHAWFTAPSGTAGTAISFTQAMTLDASGNLLVGTTNSGYGKLGVYSASNTLIGIANSTSYAQLQQNGADLYINTNLSGAAGGNLIFRFGASSTEAMRIASSTNVLIGTTTDSGYKLDVNGTGRFSGAAVFSSSIQAVTGFFQSANTDSVVDIFSLFNPSSTSSGVRQKFANGYGDLAAIRVSQRDNGALADDGQMQFQVASNSVLDTKMTILNTGNVGIGTTSPARPLDVNGTMRIADGSSIEWGGTSTAISGTSASNALLFYTTSTERMRITSGGLVGIGTTAPSTKLHVYNGSMMISGFQSAGNPLTFLEANYNSYGCRISFQAYNPYNGYDSDLGITLTNTSNVSYTAMYLKGSNGNVGIGTTSPATKLEISQSTDNTDGPTLRIANNANTLSNGQLIGAIDFYNGDDSGTGNAVGAYIRSYMSDAVLPTSSQYLSFATGGTTERMRITSGGNVLIGTTTDVGYKLTVNGDVAIPYNYRLRSTTDVGNSIELHNGSGVMNFYTNGTARLSLAYGGAATFSSSVSGTIFYSTGATSVNSGLSIEPSGWNGTKHRFSVPVSGDASILSYNWNGTARDNVSYGSSVIGLTQGQVTIGVGTGNPTTALTLASTGAATFSSSVTATSFIKTGGTSSQYLMADGSVTTSSGSVGGSGTTNYISKWNGTTSLANSQIFDNGTQVTVGSNVAMYKFAVNPVSTSYFGIGFTGTNSIFVNAVDSGFTSVPIVNNAISHEWLIGFGSAMLLTSSLNLLIGTTTGVSGGGKLQVNGDVNINGNFKINGTVIGGGGGSGITGSGTTNMIAKWTGGTSLGDSALYDNGAYSMGIGTTSIAFPTDRKGLVIRPNGANSGEILLQNSGNTNGSTDGFAIANINGDGVALYNRINAHIRFGTNNTERLRITEDGNLGFGTTSQFGGGVKVIGIANSTTIPNTTPSGGGILFVQNGALKYMGSNGTYTTIANA